jgi:hypothetical protein
MEASPSFSSMEASLSSWWSEASPSLLLLMIMPPSLSSLELLLFEDEDEDEDEDEELLSKEPPRDRPPLLRASAEGVPKDTGISRVGSLLGEIFPKSDTAIAGSNQAEVLRIISKTTSVCTYSSAAKPASFVTYFKTNRHCFEN